MSRELLTLEIDTLWSSDHAGTLVLARRPDPPPPPFVVIGAADDGAAIAFGPGVSPDIRADIRAMVTAGPPAPEPKWRPPSGDEILELLSSTAPFTIERSGPCYAIDPAPAVVSQEVRTSDDTKAAELIGLPEGEQLAAPWAVAAWTRLAPGRTHFYSTDWDNHASQATARRVGATPIGAFWLVEAAVA